MAKAGTGTADREVHPYKILIIMLRKYFRLREPSCSLTPPAFIHYTTAPLHNFGEDGGHFKVRTQGRLYTLALNNRRRGATTKSFKPTHALLFTDDAARQFALHPCWSFFGMKSYSRQYWTQSIGDVVWRAEDTETVVDLRRAKVLRIKSMKIVPIQDKPRRAWQFVKIAGSGCVDLVFAAYVSIWLCAILSSALAPVGWGLDWPRLLLFSPAWLACFYALVCALTKEIDYTQFDQELAALGFPAQTEPLAEHASR